MEEKVISIEGIIQDDKNFNKGTKQGREMLDYSLNTFGCGRSVLLDKDNRIIAGNKTAAAAIKAGVKNVRIIEVTGDELVAVRRADIDLDTKKGREFALADNVTSNVNFDIDLEMVMSVMREVDLHPDVWGIDSRKLFNGVAYTDKWEDPTTVTDTFKFGVYNLPLNKTESETLKQLLDQYQKEKGTTDGFITKLLDDYEQRH